MIHSRFLGEVQTIQIFTCFQQVPCVIHKPQMVCVLSCSTFVVFYIFAPCHDYIAFISIYVDQINARISKKKEKRFVTLRSSTEFWAPHPGKFENAAFSLRLGLGQPFRKRSSNWKNLKTPLLFIQCRRLNILKTKLFENEEVTTIMHVISIFHKQNSKMTAVALSSISGRVMGGKIMPFSG